jgi:hypothetical protein
LHANELATAGAEFDRDFEDADTEGDVFNIPGKRGRIRMNEMLTAERTLNMAGWLDDCEDGLPDVGSLEPVEPEYNQSSKVW